MSTKIFPWYDALSWRRKTINSKPVKLCKKIDLVSHPARAEELVNTYITASDFYQLKINK